VVEAGFGHALAEAAGLEEVGLKAADVLVKEIVGLVKQAEGNVGDDFGGAGFDERLIGRIGRMGLISQGPDVACFLGFLFPEAELPDPEVVLIVDEQFLQTGAGDVGELDLHLGRGLGGFAAFGDVLFAGPGGLDHLVYGAVSFLEKAAAEVEGDIVADFGFLVGEEVLVVSAGREESGVFWHSGAEVEAEKGK